MNDLFDPQAYHTSDPDTSRQALVEHEDSGRRKANQMIVQMLVLRYPRSTACELWDAANDDTKAKLVELQEIRRRLTDLLQTGKVRQLDARKCSVKGSKQVVWECCQ